MTLDIPLPRNDLDDMELKPNANVRHVGAARINVPAPLERIARYLHLSKITGQVESAKVEPLYRLVAVQDICWPDG